MLAPQPTVFIRLVPGGSIVEGTLLAQSRQQMATASRLFYELGTFTHFIDGQWYNWRPRGVFKEIDDPDVFAATDEYLDDPAYRAHHHFRYLP